MCLLFSNPLCDAKGNLVCLDDMQKALTKDQYLTELPQNPPAILPTSQNLAVRVRM